MDTWKKMVADGLSKDPVGEREQSHTCKLEEKRKHIYSSLIHLHCHVESFNLSERFTFVMRKICFLLLTVKHKDIM